MSAQLSVAGEAILLREDRDGVVTLVLNRPARFNALSEEMLSALQAALDDIKDDDTVRCVVLAASGKAFCAGHDLKQMRANPRQDYYETLFAQCSRVMQSIVDLPVPVIARVHGMATAAGCQLVATCDLAVASESATFAVSGIDVGLFCSTPAVALSRNVAPKHAFDMLVTGRFISSAEALSFGLVNRVAPDAELDRGRGRPDGRYLRQKPCGDPHGQGDVRAPALHEPRGGLYLRRQRHGLQHDGRGCRRGHRRLHREAQARVEGALRRSYDPSAL